MDFGPADFETKNMLTRWIEPLSIIVVLLVISYAVFIRDPFLCVVAGAILKDIMPRE